MICIGFPESRFQVTVIIFYTCIWLPLRRLKEAFVEAVLALLGKFHRPTEGFSSGAADFIYPDLPLAKFKQVRATAAVAESMCSVCLMEFEEEEEVSQLPVCGHVFHLPCIGKWITRDQFSCPLCRSPIFGSSDVGFCGNDF
ncbi:RING-H2 finger protein ATL18-like [Aristolochia californica]|uniref:RING-H2 finger protein ATL18-like n=1 Tax=Aristolochia californica TaxID=171875 RepID=UPI0035DB29FA